MRKDDKDGDVEALGDRRSLDRNHRRGEQLRPVGEKCNSLKTDKSGDRCKQAAGLGTDHPGWGRCKFHGGSTQSGKTSALKEKLSEKERFLGNEVVIEPTEALLGEIRRTAGHVNWLHGQILRFGDDMGDNGSSVVLFQIGDVGQMKASWVKLYQDERTHLVKVAKMALDAGVAERQVKLAESQGELIATALRGILKDLGLSAEQEALAPDIVRRHLRAVS